MSKYALDFLVSSPLWEQASIHENFRDITNEDLKKELARYRAHILARPPAPSSSLRLALSARQELLADEGAVRRSSMYFDEVMLPDPLFKVTEAVRERSIHIEIAADGLRHQVRIAICYMKSLLPMVQLGRVCFIPSTHVLEGPAHLPFFDREDAFAGDVPVQLRDWFANRTRVRKVVIDKEKQLRYVLRQGPDSNTQSINIDFGQLGPQRGQDFMSLVEPLDENAAAFALDTPRDEETLHRWVTQSANKAAGDFLKEVLADAGYAWNLGASFVTSCQATASLLDYMRVPPAEAAAEAMSLELPVVEDATFSQLAQLLESESSAFEAFRFELKIAVEALALIEDPHERRAEARKITDRLNREQLNEVDRKIRESTRKLKWNIPITVAGLGAGALGILIGDNALLSAIIGSLSGGASVLTTIRDHQDYRALPGYFVWKLRQNRDD